MTERATVLPHSCLVTVRLNHYLVIQDTLILSRRSLSTMYTEYTNALVPLPNTPLQFPSSFPAAPHQLLYSRGTAATKDSSKGLPVGLLTAPPSAKTSSQLFSMYFTSSTTTVCLTQDLYKRRARNHLHFTAHWESTPVTSQNWMKQRTNTRYKTHADDQYIFCAPQMQRVTLVSKRTRNIRELRDPFKVL